MRFGRRERSWDLGWKLAHAIVERQHFFCGVFKEERRTAVREGWLVPGEYVRGFLDVLTNYGLKPRIGVEKGVRL